MKTLSIHNSENRIINFLGNSLGGEVISLLLFIAIYGLVAVLNPFPFASSILMALFSVLWIWGTKGTLQAIGLKKIIQPGKTLGITFLIFILLFLALDWGIAPAIEWATGTEPDTSSFDFIKGNTTAWLQYLGVSWFIAALCEEIVFRGFIMNVIHRLTGEQKWGKWMAILVSSALFGIVHYYQGLSGILLTGSVGLCMAIIYFRMNRNLWVCILLHALIDTTSITLIYLGLF